MRDRENETIAAIDRIRERADSVASEGIGVLERTGADAREKIAESIEHGKAIYGHVVTSAREGSRTANNLFHKNAYPIVTVAVVLGVMFGYLLAVRLLRER